MKYKQAIVRLI